MKQLYKHITDVKNYSPFSQDRVMNEALRHDTLAKCYLYAYANIFDYPEIIDTNLSFNFVNVYHENKILEMHGITDRYIETAVQSVLSESKFVPISQSIEIFYDIIGGIKSTRKSMGDKYKDELVPILIGLMHKTKTGGWAAHRIGLLVSEYGLFFIDSNNESPVFVPASNIAHYINYRKSYSEYITHISLIFSQNQNIWTLKQEETILRNINLSEIAKK